MYYSSLLYHFVNDSELVGPVGVDDYGSQVEAVVVCVVWFGMHTGGGHCLFVSIDAVHPEEVFHFLSHLRHRRLTPFGFQGLEHGHRPHSSHFAESPEDRQFGVGHAHVGLVCLGEVSLLGQRGQFSSGSLFYYVFQGLGRESLLGVEEECLEIVLGE